MASSYKKSWTVSNHRALHMSVNYNGNGWKQTLDPIIQNRKESDPDQKLELRKNTYSISSQEDRESNIGSQIWIFECKQWRIFKYRYSKKFKLNLVAWNIKIHCRTLCFSFNLSWTWKIETTNMIKVKWVAKLSIILLYNRESAWYFYKAI